MSQNWPPDEDAPEQPSPIGPECGHHCGTAHGITSHCACGECHGTYAGACQCDSPTCPHLGRPVPAQHHGGLATSPELCGACLYGCMP